jgi:hypothetical protein
MVGGGRYLPAWPAAAGGGIPLVLVGVAGPGFLNSRPASSAGLSHVDNPDETITDCKNLKCVIGGGGGGRVLWGPANNNLGYLYISTFRF